MLLKKHTYETVVDKNGLGYWVEGNDWIDANIAKKLNDEFCCKTHPNHLTWWGKLVKKYA
jgi:hypothetical protein